MAIHIETERLFIRELEPADAEGMFAMDSDPEVHRYVGNTPVEQIGQTREVIDFIRAQYLEFGIGRWAIIEKSSGDFAGWIGHKRAMETTNGHSGYVDFGYRLAHRFWGRGYATEAGHAVLHYGIETLGLTDIFATTDVDNTASRRVLEKLGFTFVELFKWEGPSGWRHEGQPTTWYKLPQ